MRSAPLLRIAASLLLISNLLSAVSAVGFTCNATATATCEGVVGLVPVNSTTYAAIQAIFQVPSLRSLLGANGLPVSTPPTRPVLDGSTVRVPFRCVCANGTGSSDHTPVYTVKAGDGLDDVARGKFGGLVTYKDIAAANGLPDPNKIEVGQRLWIPLPCSCDPVGGQAVVHLGHVVAAGSSVGGIAAEYGTDEETLLRLNGIADPKSLKAEQVLDVPLQACSSSSISSSSLDHNLLVPNGSYALTARDCILCSCNSSNQSLDCRPTQGLSSSVCPAAMCGSMYIGNTSASGCDLKSCSYGGYTNGTRFTILANTTTLPTCGSGSGSSSNGGLRMLGSKGGNWNELLIILVHMSLLLFCFLP